MAGAASAALASWLPARVCDRGTLCAMWIRWARVVGANTDAGSIVVPCGLLVDAVGNAGIPLTTADGLIAGTVPAVTPIGVGLDVFIDTPGASFATTNGAWAVLGGTIGGTAENRVLIAQLTTNGQLGFNLNMRIGIPDSLQCQGPGCHTYIDYFATIQPADTAGGGITADNICTNPTLIFTGQVVDCLGVPGGSALPGTTCDDGDAATGADVYGNNCVCAGLLIDCENVPGGSALPATPCDDNDPNTLNDAWSQICTCEGTIGMNELGSIAALAAFPNPTRDQVTVTFSTTTAAPMSILLRDAVGQVVMAMDLGTVSGERRELPEEGAAVIPSEDLRLLEEMEDAEDVRAADEALAEGGEPIPWETIKAKLDAE